MIKVTKLNKEEIYVNPDLVEYVEANPDTALHLRGGKRMVVRDQIEDVVKSIMEYKKYIHANITVRNSSK